MRQTTVAIVLTLLFASSTFAHHVFNVDRTKPVRLTGTVTSTEWRNPHAFIHITAAGDKGGATSWVILCGSPNTLRRVGVNEETLAPGTTVTVDAYRDKDRTNWLDGMSITLKDGRKLPLYAIMMKDVQKPN